MAYCPTCDGTFPSGKFCPKDGTLLVQRQGDAEAPTPKDQDPMVGQVVAGRFRVVRLLGKGGMGTVYEAEHTFIKKRVALKMLRPEITSNPEAVERFRREALATSTIGHDNIVTIDDFGILDDGQVYLTMEFLPGAPLNQVLLKEIMPVSRVLELILQVCQGLAAAHELSIVHRDMKPENVFLVEDGGRVKILDFGIAKVTGSGDSTNLTKTGAIFGTPNYMAPEQALGKKVDHRADIYAVGIMLYEMLTGRVPFQSESFLAVLTQHVTETPLPLREVAPNRQVDAELEALVMKSISKKPEERYPDMAALIRDLERAMARLAAQPAPVFDVTIPPTVIPGVAVAGGVSNQPIAATIPAERVAETGADTTGEASEVAPPVDSGLVAPVMESNAGGVTATAGELIGDYEEPRRRRTGLLLAGMAALVLLVGGGALAYNLLSDPGPPSGGPLAVAPGDPADPDHEGGVSSEEVAPTEPPPAEVTPEEKPTPAVKKPARKPKPRRKPRAKPRAKPAAKPVTKPIKPVTEPIKPKPGPTSDEPPPLPPPAGSVWNRIISNPAGCDILDGGRVIGKTPKRMEVPKGKTFRFILRYPGFNDRIVTLIGDHDRVIRVEMRRLGQPVSGDDHGKSDSPEGDNKTARTPPKRALTPAERRKRRAARRKALQEARAKARKAKEAQATGTSDDDDEILDVYED